jgi:hypothetical protein
MEKHLVDNVFISLKDKEMERRKIPYTVRHKMQYPLHVLKYHQRGDKIPTVRVTSAERGEPPNIGHVTAQQGRVSPANLMSPKSPPLLQVAFADEESYQMSQFQGTIDSIQSPPTVCGSATPLLNRKKSLRS